MCKFELWNKLLAPKKIKEAEKVTWRSIFLSISGLIWPCASLDFFIPSSFCTSPLHSTVFLLLHFLPCLPLWGVFFLWWTFSTWRLTFKALKVLPHVSLLLFRFFSFWFRTAGSLHGQHYKHLLFFFPLVFFLGSFSFVPGALSEVGSPLLYFSRGPCSFKKVCCWETIPFLKKKKKTKYIARCSTKLLYMIGKIKPN